MSETVNDELGRTKQSATPREHLAHLLDIGWSWQSPLIQKYVRQHGLQHQLEEWQKKASSEAGLGARKKS